VIEPVLVTTLSADSAEDAAATMNWPPVMVGINVSTM
jgi:hypothetical protein